MSKRNKYWLLVMGLLLVGCQSEENFKEKLEKTLSKNPDLIFKMIEKNPDKFLSSFQIAIEDKKKRMAKEKEEKTLKELNHYLDNPIPMKLASNETFRGNPKGDLTLIEYIDFQCGFCKRSNETVQTLMKVYPNRIRVVYKHLPLNFHPQAQIAAQYYEAIKLQSKEKAHKFHDLIFQKQSALSKGEKFLNQLVSKVGADQGKVKRDLYSETIIKKIKGDIQEANALGINGTPGFIFNGIPIRGAYPLEYFKMVIEKMDERKKPKKDS